jgi:hypothetical protein
MYKKMKIKFVSELSANGTEISSSVVSLALWSVVSSEAT